MHSRLRIWLATIFVCCFNTVLLAQDDPDQLAIDSPDGKLTLVFSLDEAGRPGFEATYGGTTVCTGKLGLQFADSESFAEGFAVVGTKRSSHDRTYEIPVGKAASARDQHHELIVSLEDESSRRKLDIAFRAFDDGIAFRYLIPEQESLGRFLLTDEQSELTFPGDPLARALPVGSYTSSYEEYYKKVPVSGIGADELIGVPLLLELPRSGQAPLWVAITEANLTDYAGMYLSGTESPQHSLTAKLSPLPRREDGAKVLGETPHASPWRVLMMAENPGHLIESNLVFHLNEPCQVADTSWIKPGKTTFPWWNGYMLEDVDFEPGVNTQTMKYYIDFCAEQGIPYHSLDGLDIAWYGGPIRPDGPADITTGAPSIDVEEIVAYAKQKGVRLRLWMHWKPLESQIDEAFQVYEQWGIEGVMVDFMDRDDQEMVRFYHEIAEKAAKHHLTVTLHGAYKPTGMERTWPNVLSYEAALNQEYNKWEGNNSRGTPPRHNLDIAYVRMLAGPLDYHQGGMRSVLPENYHFRSKAPPVQGTRGHQLAMYVVYQNHLSMLADYPSAYRGEPGFRFLVDVPANWDETRVLHTEIDDCLVVARRSGDTWYLGGMTGRDGRTFELPLEFLNDMPYRVTLHADDPDRGPNALSKRNDVLSSNDTLEVAMSPGGGFVAVFAP